ncbi:MAG TPA: PEP-CTERM sorting domain-containing protein [Pirellulales bacterium]|nr:PEP-CTERM sorting domain-containing protein [Pirellulales bacterium]
MKFIDISKFNRVAVALAVIGYVSTAAIAAPLLHDYELNGNYLDSLGGPAITPEGGTMTATYHQLTPTIPAVQLNNNNNGLTLNSPGLTDPGAYTIYMRLDMQELRSQPYDRGYIKLLDFKDGGYDDIDPGKGYTSNVYYDNGLYAYEATAGSGKSSLVFYGDSGGSSPTPVITQNQWFDLVVTRDATGEFKAYSGATLLFSFNDAAGDAVFDHGDNTMRFYQDDLFTFDPDPANPHRADYEFGDGRIDFIRIYDGALSATEIAAIVPEPGSLPLLAVGGLGVFFLARKCRTTVAPCATTVA